MQSGRRTLERQYCELCRSITKASSTPTRPRPPGRLSVRLSISLSHQIDTPLKLCSAKTQAGVRLYVVHLFIEPSLPPGMAALMNPTYVKEQIRALEADLCLCVVTVSGYICSGICCGSHQSGVELPLQINTLLQWHGLFRNALGIYRGRITGISLRKALIPFLLNHLWSINLWIARMGGNRISFGIFSTWTFVCWPNKAEDVIPHCVDCLLLVWSHNGSRCWWVSMTDQCNCLGS